MVSRKYEMTHLGLLLLAAFIWGTAFVAQSVGAELVGPFTFLAGRSWLATVVMTPLIAAKDRILIRKTGSSGAPANGAQRRRLLFAGCMCGVFLFAASAAQQIGIARTTTAKSSFITALYVVIVPILSIPMGRKPERKMWICILFSVIGLYLLCMTGAEGLNDGDAWTLLCAVLFAVQILCIDHFVTHVDGFRLSRMQFLATAVLATVAMLLTETPDRNAVMAALPSIAYAGIMSSCAGYTLQIVGQTNINPSKAVLAMCMESVFGALSGWVILGQSLSLREISGCALMFAAIVLSQVSLPIGKKAAS